MADSTFLKEAIVGGDFETARVLIINLSEKVKGDMRSVRGEERRAAFERGIQLLGEALTAARLVRSHAALRLSTILGQRAYQSVHDNNSWSVEA